MAKLIISKEILFPDITNEELRITLKNDMDNKMGWFNEFGEFNPDHIYKVIGSGEKVYILISYKVVD